MRSPACRRNCLQARRARPQCPAPSSFRRTPVGGSVCPQAARGRAARANPQISVVRPVDQHIPSSFSPWKALDSRLRYCLPSGSSRKAPNSPLRLRGGRRAMIGAAGGDARFVKGMHGRFGRRDEGDMHLVQAGAAIRRPSKTAATCRSRDREWGSSALLPKRKDWVPLPAVGWRGRAALQWRRRNDAPLARSETTMPV